ncbi:MAG TPA: hypothetical protein DCF63_15180 [Planctomycetaceae bacterium]|nr:hypothetical protein [Planctomycetaceae bacterium]
MKRNVNLLPAKTRMSIQWKRQIRGWAMVWLAVTLVLGVGIAVLEHARKTVQENLRSAELQIVQVRQTEASAKRLSYQAQQARKLVDTGAMLEQTDVPLALFQLVHQCCQKAGDGLHLQSWRMSESLGETSQANASHKKNSSSRGRAQDAKDGSKSIRKQVMLNGQSEPEACLSLVSWLRASGAFRSVDLMSTQALSDEPGARQSFQIRCEQ